MTDFETLPLTDKRVEREDILTAIEKVTDLEQVQLSGADAAYILLALRNLQSTQIATNAVIMALAGGNPVPPDRMLRLIGSTNQAGHLIDVVTMKLAGMLTEEDVL